MESLGLTVDFDFFVERMNYFRWLDQQQRKIEELFDCDIYGGPLLAWNKELDLWAKICKNTRSRDLIASFASYYGFGRLTNKFSYDWNEEDTSYHTVEISLSNEPITDEIWLRVVWDEIMRLEADV